jgi:RimJ/RimL family protein N-acetyltransferase
MSFAHAPGLREAAGAVAGMTSYTNADEAYRRLEIGATWYRARFRRTALNTGAKLLLLKHAFESLGCIAVEFRTSSQNLPGRRAIERLGASLDGVLRSHGRHRDGSLRDTCVYSIIVRRRHRAWAKTVKQALRERGQVGVAEVDNSTRSRAPVEMWMNVPF